MVLSNKCLRSCPSVTPSLNYALVKYAPGMTLNALLDIYGISEKRTDLVRSLLSGNDLAYINKALTLSNGRPIPNGKVIQMPKRVISKEILAKTNVNEKAGTSAPADAKAKSTQSAPSVLGLYPS